MALDVARCRIDLDALEAEAAGWSQPDPPGHGHWRDRLSTLAAEILGPNDALVARISWMRFSSGDLRRASRSGPVAMWSASDTRALGEAKSEAADIIKTLRWHLDRRVLRTDPFSDATIDPELWAHVQGLVDAGDWEKVAREAAVFVESKLRTWVPAAAAASGSVDAFKAAINTTPGSGGFVLAKGGKPAEPGGWQQLAIGFALALRNPSGHTVAQRPDAERYALGVLGVASLLLTQVRHEYGDPPKP